MKIPDTPSPPPLQIASLLRQFDLRPDKRFGQNFLQDESALKKIVAAANIGSDDTILEIGPGLGSLTRYLALVSRQVIAVELDDRLIPALEHVVAPYTNVRIVPGDILKISPASLIGEGNYNVVANIPYNITSAILRHLLESARQPQSMVLTVQKEVAERICEKPGNMSLLALSVQVYGSPAIIAKIPAGAFYPAPKVDSAIVKIDLHEKPFIAPKLLETFFALIKAGFSQKRKTLRNTLSTGLAIKPAAAEQLLLASDIDPMRRAETLSLDEWQKLTANYANIKPGK